MDNNKLLCHSIYVASRWANVVKMTASQASISLALCILIKTLFYHNLPFQWMKFCINVCIFRLFFFRSFFFCLYFRLVSPLFLLATNVKRYHWNEHRIVMMAATVLMNRICIFSLIICMIRTLNSVVVSPSLRDSVWP